LAISTSVGSTSANIRQATNFFEGLLNADGVLHTEQVAMEQIAIEYFSTSFSSSGHLVMEEVLDCIEP